MNHETQRRRRYGPGLAVAAVAAVLAVGLFGVPLGSVLFVGLLLLCPLMMMGMHGGHDTGSDVSVHDHGPIDAGSPRGGSSSARTSGQQRP